MGVWNGKESYFRKGKINLGLWRELYKACKELDVSFKIENKEDVPINKDITLDDVTSFCKDYFKDHKIYDKKTKQWVEFMPYEHQIQSAYKIMRNRCHFVKLNFHHKID